MKKAYQISAYDVESVELIFAESPSKAKAIAIDYNYDLADEGYVNLTATRKKSSTNIYLLQLMIDLIGATKNIKRF